MLVLQYIDGHNNIQESFFEFIKLEGASADTIATALLKRLRTNFPDEQEGKLIAQAYDRWGTEKVQDVYQNAY